MTGFELGYWRIMDKQIIFFIYDLDMIIKILDNMYMCIYIFNAPVRVEQFLLFHF